MQIKCAAAHTHLILTNTRAPWILRQTWSETLRSPLDGRQMPWFSRWSSRKGTTHLFGRAFCSCRILTSCAGRMSATNISVRAELLRQSGCTASEPSETTRWQITPRPASIPCVALHMAMWLLFCRYVLALSVSCFKQRVWRCDQLWPYVGTVSLGTRLHWDCNALGDAVTKSPRSPPTLNSRSIRRTWVDMILPGRVDRRNGVDPLKARVRPKVGKDRVCIFVVWQDEMKMRYGLSTPGSAQYIVYVADSPSITHQSPYSHRGSFHLRSSCISIYPPSLLNDKLHPVVARVWRCTGRLWWSDFGDALGGRDGVNSEMHLEAVIDRVWRCTVRPRWGELRDALGGRDRASLEMHWEAKVKWTQRCTWRPWLIQFGDALGGPDRV